MLRDNLVGTQFQKEILRRFEQWTELISSARLLVNQFDESRSQVVVLQRRIKELQENIVKGDARDKHELTHSIEKLQTLNQSAVTRREDTKRTVRAVIDARFSQVDGIFLALTRLQLDCMSRGYKNAKAHLQPILDDFVGEQAATESPVQGGSRAQDDALDFSALTVAASSATPMGAAGAAAPAGDLLDLLGQSSGNTGYGPQGMMGQGMVGQGMMGQGMMGQGMMGQGMMGQGMMGQGMMGQGMQGNFGMMQGHGMMGQGMQGNVGMMQGHGMMGQGMQGNFGMQGQGMMGQGLQFGYTFLFFISFSSCFCLLIWVFLYLFV